MKTAFIISGFNMSISAADEKYEELRNAVASKGYKVIPVPFHWNYTTVSEYVDKFIPFYEENKGTHNTVVGNSYGAMVAFLSAPIVQPDRVLCCSLSPYFKEDWGKTTEEYRVKRFGKRRNNAQKYLSAKETAREINRRKIPLVLLYGEQEKELYPELVARIKETANDLNDCEVVEVPDAPHPFRDPAYIKGIAKEL